MRLDLKQKMKERMMSYFPEYYENLINLATLYDVCFDIELSEEEKKIKIDYSYFSDKLNAAIHEAGHIVALLLLGSECEMIDDARIYSPTFYRIKKEIHYTTWSGAVDYNKKNYSNDEVLMSVLNTAGVNALLAFGRDEYTAYIGSKSDMDSERENMLKNIKRGYEIDQSYTWSHQKAEYKQYMEEEASILSNIVKEIMRENMDAIAVFARELYNSCMLDHEEIKKIASEITLGRENFDGLKQYISLYYKEPKEKKNKKKA